MSKARKDAPDPQLLAAYREHNAAQLTRSVMVANVIAMIGMPSGAILDYFLYPEKFLEFVSIRFGVDFILFAIIGVLFMGRAHPKLGKAKVFGVLSAVMVNASFCSMIYITEGAESPYFAGLILAIMLWSTLLPWTVVQTLIMCVSSIVIYGVACVANPTFARASPFALMGFNISFLNITTIVAVGITIFLSRARFEDFRLRHRLDAQNRELQDLDRLKTQFFSNVSHELRTPLTLILGPVENLLVRGEALDAKVHEGLMLIHRNSLRLLKLINDLLDLTRLGEGADILRKRSIPIAPYVRGIVESVRHLGLSKQLRIKVEEGDPKLETIADPARIEKVLVNLLTNAIKYTPSGGSIAVRWKARETAATIEIEDTGVGIPPQDLARIFDRFHQVRSNSANHQQGVGIGLALAKELVEEHGGKLEVESVLGRGSTFRIVLPAAAPSAVQPAPVLAEFEIDEDEPFEKAFRSADRTMRSFGDDPDEDLPALGKGREVVLVADDENDMRQFIVSLLTEDYRVVQTRHGGNVTDLVAEHEPNVVLLDWMMPGKNGLELCRELRAAPARRDLKIMLLTARIDEQSKLEALNAGADDFLTKPFSSIEVKTRVANLLRAARFQRDLRTRNEELTATIDKLRHTEMMLIQSEKMNAIGSLSAGLLHEINNPLNYTLTAISLVQQSRDILDAEMQELVADIEEGMIRVRDVITNLKDFAYPERPGQVSEFALGDTFRDARKMTARELEGIRVEGDLPAHLTVKGQKTQITHLFINLLTNAARALNRSADPVAKIITVRATVAEEFVAIEVADNGPGISEEIIHRVFEPFFTTEAVGAGMGMGLSVCHTIVQSHGGSIRAGNLNTGGAVFTIRIPLVHPTEKLC